jgi:precorrin-6A/cobalt-precorrin-6A reductase
MGLHVLILGGTSLGRLLAEELYAAGRHRVLLSFAGRTESLVRPDLPHRVGGFGGAAGLASFLREGCYDALIDATHAFAAQISHNAYEAARAVQLPLLRLVGPAWPREHDDRWIDVENMAAAAAALGAAPRRVLLTVGRLEVGAFVAAPQHDYLIRAVDAFELPAALPRARLLCARGPFSLEDERALLERERIELVVSKNAGTASTYAKVEAARALNLPLVMVQRPPLPPEVTQVGERAEAHDWLERLHGASQRGV